MRPGVVRQLLDAPGYVHLSTPRADGSPRNWVVWVRLEDDYILVRTSEAIWKAKDMRRDPQVALSVTDLANPYRHGHDPGTRRSSSRWPRYGRCTLIPAAARR